MKNLLQAYKHHVSELYHRLLSNNTEELKEPTWSEISKDMQTLHGLLALNTSITNFTLRRNMQKAKETSLPSSIITITPVSPQPSTSKQPSVTTIAQMKMMIFAAQKELNIPKLVRTESGPLQEALTPIQGGIEVIQGPSPTKKKKRRGTKVDSRSN
jgi:hypothetical protein